MALDIGVSGLLTAQRALQTVAHNIANVNTPGYNRQEVDLRARPAQYFGGQYFAQGVEVQGVSRVVDQFLIDQVRSSAASHGQAAAFHDLASQVDNLLAQKDAGLSSALQGFFDQAQALANDPSSIPARQVFLSEGETLAARFNDLQMRLDDLEKMTSGRLQGAVDGINSLTSSIAKLNEAITRTTGAAGGNPPNDLLDQRDQLVDQLSGLVGVQVSLQEDGALNVTTGNGQSLVTGSTSLDLKIVANSLDASQPEIAYTVNGTTSLITQNMSGGELSGILDFRQDVLIPAKNQLGRVAAGLASTLNNQHRQGMDLDGNLGGDLFSIPAPKVMAGSSNVGTVSVAFDAANVSGLTAADYSLTYNGGNFILTNLKDNAAQTLTGAGPFDVDGLTITVGAAPAAGDSYLIRPTRDVAGEFSIGVTDPRSFAAAAPVRTKVALTNDSNAAISAGEVIDIANPDLLDTVTITFNDPPTTYQVNGVGATGYTSGGNIDINGWRVQVNGSPKAGDTFTIERNTGGVADNRNALRLAGLRNERVMQGGNATLQSAYAHLVGDVGSETRRAEISSKALAALQTQANDARAEKSGVNLDEEAANLLRYQQAYQAAAQVITAADSMFKALMNAVGR
jgi:flagellar hook-associated protein 1 FlgK